MLRACGIRVTIEGTNRKLAVKYSIKSAASPSTFLAAAGGSSTIYRAKILTTAPDIAISVAGDEVKTYVDSVEVAEGEQWSLVDDHRDQIRAAVTPLLEGFARATILGRWITYQGRGLIDPYAIELIDPSGRAKLRGYDLRIFLHDEVPMAGIETSFTDQDGEHIMSRLMSITEDKIMLDETIGFLSRGWPIGLFWFSDDGEACLAYHAIGQRAFSKTRYARIASEMGEAPKTVSKDTHLQGNASRTPS